MTITTNQFKNGTHIEVDGIDLQIIEFQHVKPGKGGAFVRTKLRRIDDGSVHRQDLQGGGEFRRFGPNAQDAVPIRLGRGGGVHGHADYEQLELPRSRRRVDAMGPAELRGRGALRRRADRRACRCRARSRWRSPRPSRASKATPHRVAAQAGDAGVGRVGRGPAVRQRGRRVRVDTEAASTSRAPDPRGTA